MAITREVLLGCLSVPRWADNVLAGQPYDDQDALIAAADSAARELSDEELDQALSGHPRIGERGGAPGMSAQSQKEQSGVDPTAGDTAARLRAGNAAYEERFDRVFLIRAAGRDAEVGRPARGIDVRLETRDGELLGEGVTDDDGRVGSIGPETLERGAYVLRFDTGTYVDGFYPEVVVVFTVNDPDQHYHVPVLLSPYGYSTYRGS